ncbi:terminase small subunit [Enterobacter hormaechei]|uniref:terminase small subunit n=2 Tax=Enterobacter TaxID=547 RepID=UPI0006DB1434|nr:MULTISPECIES: terminase small subunit [Enterobacter cloacae complex]HAV1961814.1 hypothetical protein [Enterobacter hormaechei subsp. xiangfangensis]EJK8935820.1 hypothetical protein [Enterobacter hormaechei]EJK8939208.1 hypothetical protein [Enterobacter hormaechei]EKS6613026.1 hypothetical protein [Enterobacter hormaechei]EKU3255314.1 hypothetical protein [Enterobacter hormaechei]
MAGRKPKYKKEYCESVVAWFSEKKDHRINESEKGVQKVMPGDSLATMTGYARHIGVTRRTLMLWCERYPEFKEAYEWAEELNADQIARASFMGSTPSQAAALLLVNCHGWTSAAQGKMLNEGRNDPANPLSGETVPEATAFVVTVVKDREDAYYQLWLDRREKNKLLSRDEDEGLEQFELYDENDAEQLREVAKVRGHLLGLLEMLPDE